jgi:hypothetical protein
VHARFACALSPHRAGRLKREEKKYRSAANNSLRNKEASEREDSRSESKGNSESQGNSEGNSESESENSASSEGEDSASEDSGSEEHIAVHQRKTNAKTKPAVPALATTSKGKTPPAAGAARKDSQPARKPRERTAAVAAAGAEDIPTFQLPSGSTSTAPRPVLPSFKGPVENGAGKLSRKGAGVKRTQPDPLVDRTDLSGPEDSAAKRTRSSQ